MTSPAPETLEREKDKLFVSDAELIRRIGVPEKYARKLIRDLDAKARTSGFPQKQKLWGDRRYWPDVRAYFDATVSRKMGVSQREKRHDG